MADPHLNAIGFWQVQQTKDGPMRFPGIPTWFSATPPAVRDSAPALGEHSRALLREAGYDEAAIAALFERGAVFTSPARDAG